MIFEQHGVLIGVALLLAVSACGLLLARKAARNIQSFREEQHERFTRRTDV